MYPYLTRLVASHWRSISRAVSLTVTTKRASSQYGRLTSEPSNATVDINVLLKVRTTKKSCSSVSMTMEWPGGFRDMCLKISAL